MLARVGQKTNRVLSYIWKYLFGLSQLCFSELQRYNSELFMLQLKKKKVPRSVRIFGKRTRKQKKIWTVGILSVGDMRKLSCFCFTMSMLYQVGITPLVIANVCLFALPAAKTPFWQCCMSNYTMKDITVKVTQWNILWTFLSRRKGLN